MGVDDLEAHERPRWSAPRIPWRFALTDRDRRIIERALEKIGGAEIDFAEAMRAMREAVEEEIPDGRIFLLGNTEHGPMLGSIISGVGIVDAPAGVQLVRAKPGDAPSVLGRFKP